MLKSQASTMPILPHHASTLLQKKESPIAREVEGVLQALKKARKFYAKAELEFGIAKTNIIEAEFHIDNSYGSGFHLEYNP